jgi:hypothetical protein
MIRKQQQPLGELPKIPLFFKIWFVFVALLCATVFAGVALTVINVLNAGPEGIGQAAGAFVRAFNESFR